MADVHHYQRSRSRRSTNHQQRAGGIGAQGHQRTESRSRTLRSPGYTNQRRDNNPLEGFTNPALGSDPRFVPRTTETPSMYPQHPQQGPHPFGPSLQRHNYPIHHPNVRQFPNHLGNPQAFNPQHHGQLSHEANGHHSQMPNFLPHQQNPYANVPHNGGMLQLNSSQIHSATPGHGSSPYNKPITEHWAHQLDLAEKSHKLKTPNAAAKQFGVDTRDAQKAAVSTNLAKDGVGEEQKTVDGEEEDHREKQKWSLLDLGGHHLRNLSPALFNYRFLTALHLSHNELQVLPPVIGQLRKLQTLDVSHNALKELPPEMGMLTRLEELMLFENQIHELPFELGSLFRLKVLGIEGNPLQENLKSELMQNGSNALIRLLRENAPTTAPPPDREWIALDETTEPSGDDGEIFTAMTFNILCNHSATQAQYGHTPSRVLDWGYRSQLIVEEIKKRLPDILCLQEVDTNAFEDLLSPALAYEGYRGIHSVKSRARTLPDEQMRGVDGCATFYKTDRYMVLDKHTVGMISNAINRPDMKGYADIFNRVMEKDNIAQIIFLENIMTGARLIVSNVHLTWSPLFKDVKLVQTAILMDALQLQSERYAKWPPKENKKRPKSYGSQLNGDNANHSNGDTDGEPGPSMSYSSNTAIPMIVCGDFNSKTDSGVYEIMALGSVPGDHADFMEHKYGDITKFGIKHPFSLQSAYSEIGELAVTNHTDNFSAGIDYIWYSTPGLQVTGLLGPVDDGYLKRVPGFPDHHFPSDHISLVAEFMVKRKKQVLSKGQAGAKFGDALTTGASSK